MKGDVCRTGRLLGRERKRNHRNGGGFEERSEIAQPKHLNQSDHLS